MQRVDRDPDQPRGKRLLILQLFALHPSFAGRFLHDFQRIGFVSHITECYGV